MYLRINGEMFILWGVVDAAGHEIDVFLQKRRNKKAAIRFLTRLLGNYPKPQVIVTEKLYKASKVYMPRSKAYIAHKTIIVLKMRINQRHERRNV